MCGRFTLVRLADFLDRFPWIDPPDAAEQSRYNIAPSQQIAVVTNQEPKIVFHRWGLVPSWAKDPAIGNRMINARAETLAEKPAFKRLLSRRRCLIPADGLYEWKKSPDGKTKTPMYIHLKSGHAFAFAGLWDTWRDPDGAAVPTCTIITTSPNELMKTIHDRMPAVLREDQYHTWLSKEELPLELLQSFLAPYPAEEMEARCVSTAVNNPKYESAQILEPLAETSPKSKNNPELTLFSNPKGDTIH